MVWLSRSCHDLRVLHCELSDTTNKGAIEFSYLDYSLRVQIGIESGFYTVKTAITTPASVQEGLEIVRRTGVKVSYSQPVFFSELMPHWTSSP